MERNQPSDCEFDQLLIELANSHSIAYWTITLPAVYEALKAELYDDVMKLWSRRCDQQNKVNKERIKSTNQ